MPPSTEAFARALRRTLRYEGGYVDHPSDPGGATNQGVTQGAYDRYRNRHRLEPRPVKHITPDEVRAVYLEDYWRPIGGDQINAQRAAALFDAAVHSGVSRALAWDHEAGGDWRALTARRLAFLTNLTTWPVFSRGWSRRIAALIAELTEEERMLELEAGITGEERLLIVHDDAGAVAARVPIRTDLLLRVTPTRAYVRPDPTTPQGGETA